jgi:exosortase family protein XrtF
MSIFNENKPALLFLITFVGLYLLLNTLYGLYVNSFLPQPDPITILVSKQVAGCLSLADTTITSSVMSGSKYVPIRNSYRTVIEVFEGCNGINVMIVFISFLLAYRGKLKATLLFGSVGIVVIHMMNLFRVSMLYGIELYFPRYLYFFHKYLFTGMIYAVVFLMWYLWAKRLKRVSAQ